MKVKFYSLKFCIAAVLLLLGVSGPSFAQVHTGTVEDIFLGNTYTQSGSVLKYTYTLTNDKSTPLFNFMIMDVMPVGTTYVQGSTEVNGVSWPDVNGVAPTVANSWSNPVYVPLPNGAGVLSPGETATITYMVTVDANAASIIAYETQFQVNLTEEQRFNTLFGGTSLPIVDDISCTAAYLSNAGTADANTLPGNTAANSIISSMNPSTGYRLTTVFNGNSINNYYANNNQRLPIGITLLKDASAIAFDNATQRIYFANNSTTAQQELYYVSLTTSPARAYKFSYTNLYYLNTNVGTGYNITRMTFTPWGDGYALTDNAQELIKFTVNGNVPTITNLGPVRNSPQNLDNLIENETGGDLCADYQGLLYLVTYSGKIYQINLDPAGPISYLNYELTTGGTTPIGLPTSGNNSIAIGPDGRMLVSGSYQDVYKIDLYNMTATSITGGITSNVFTSGDMASCYYPQFPLKKETKPVADKPAIAQASINATARVNPNPFISNLTVQVTLPAAEKVHFKLMDLYGRTVLTRSENLSGGTNTFTLNAPGKLAPGMYVLDVWAGNKRLLQKKLSHL